MLNKILENCKTVFINTNVIYFRNTAHLSHPLFHNGFLKNLLILVI